MNAGLRLFIEDFADHTAWLKDAKMFDRAADHLAFVDPVRHAEAIAALRDRAQVVRDTVAELATKRWSA